MFKAVIVGFGDIAYFLSKDKKRKKTWSHFEAYNSINETKVYAVVERDQKKIDFIKKKYPQINVFRNINELINSKLNIDIISICSPTQTHFDILNRSLILKPKIIICEKPICETLSEAKKIVKLYKKKKIKIIINHQRRFETNFLIAKQIVATGKIGKVLNINANYTSKIINIGTHLIDCIRMIINSEPKFTYSIFKKNLSKKDPSVSGILYFNNDINCFIQSLGSKYKYIFEIDIIGSKGRIRVINNGKNIEFFQFKRSKNFEKYEELYKKKMKLKKQTDPMRELFVNVINAYKNKKKVYPDIHDGYQNLSIVCSMIKSAKYKKLVKI